MMRQTYLAAAAAGLLLAFGTALPAGAVDDEQAALKRAAEVGDRLYALDQAAWISTDEMRRQMPDLASAGIRGWIVEEQPDKLHVIYYRLDKPDQPTAGFIVDMRGRNILSTQIVTRGDDDTLTPIERRMVQAREIARAQPMVDCTDGPMNTVVLPPRTVDEPITVYVMSPQVTNDEYPFGGHYRFEIAPDGTVISSRKFTNACVNLPLANGGAEGRPVALAVTHFLDLTPTEIHVFISNTTRLPVMVMTPVASGQKSKSYRVWEVVGDQISLVEVKK
jgi:hypothetical protein